MAKLTRESFYEFGRFRLKPKARVLECEGKPVDLQDQGYDTLLILVRCKRHVTNKELIEAVWPDDVAEIKREPNLYVDIAKLRSALRKADPSLPELITNHRNVGYIFTAEVYEHEIPTTVAILPFEVEGESGQTDESGFKLADKLTVMLSRHATISVRRHDTVIEEHCKHPKQRPLIFGHRLTADYVFSGSIGPETVEVRALDVRAGDDAAPAFKARLPAAHWPIHQWMESVLGLPPTPRPEESASQYTTNRKAKEYYESARHQRFRNTRGSLKRAIGLFRKAIEADPDFAEAYVGLAGTYIYMGMLGLISPRGSYDGAKDAAATALLKKPTLAGAHSTSAFIKLFFEREWDEAQAGFARAIENKQNYPAAHMGYAHCLTARGRHAEALEEIDEALEDPHIFFINFVGGMTLFMARKFDRSLEQFKQTEQLNNRNDLPYYGMSLAQEYCALSREGDEREGLFEKANKNADKAILISKGNTLKLLHRCQLLAKWGKCDEAAHLLEVVFGLRRSGQYVSPYHLGIAYAALDEVEKAIESLEEALGVMDQYLFLTGVDPRLDSLRSEPGFQELLRRLGLDDEGKS